MRIQYETAWRKGGQIGNLPQAILLDLAVTFPKKERAKSKPKKAAPKPELVTTDG